MARWFGLASAQGAMARSDTERVSQEGMGRWSDSEREDQAIMARSCGLAWGQKAAARSDSQEDVTPAGAADHWDNWKREDQPARR